MKRAVVAVVVVAALLGIAGCGTRTPVAPPGGSSEPTRTSPPLAAPYAAIPTSGQHEAAALAALPKALQAVVASATPQGKKVPDLSGAKPTLIAYVVRATLDDRAVLFEVRADGRAYELGAYPSVPDPSRLTWRPVTESTGTGVKAASDGERAAIAAVTSIIKIGAPDGKPTVRIGGYNFNWIRAGKPVTSTGTTVFRVTVDPTGTSRFFTL